MRHANRPDTARFAGRCGRLRPGEAAIPLPIDTTSFLLWDELRDAHQLQSGDRLVFYTDGITERQGLLTRLGAVAPSAVVSAVVAELDQFAAGHEPDDDQTLLVAGLD